MSKYNTVPSSSIDIKIADKIASKKNFDYKQELKNANLKDESKRELLDYYKDIIEK